MASRTIVGSPLTPGLLEDLLGALGEIPPAPTSFAPDGDWVNTYRVWTCHGYRESGNEDEGFLKIERVGHGRDGRFRLNVDQQIVHTEAALNARPYRTTSLRVSIPSHEWLGYYRSSLRDFFNGTEWLTCYRSSLRDFFNCTEWLTCYRSSLRDFSNSPARDC